MAEFIKVTDLNRLAKQVLAQCDPLNNLIVCGEISNFTRHYKSGHCYFTLKDEQCTVKCVLFRDKARLLSFEPQNGMLVLVYGYVTLYERDGAFQLYAEFIRPFGAGAAQMAFDALKKKLEVEGLFAPEHKKPLPPVPNCIGVVTSKTGAALQDVLQVIGRRWPMEKLLLAPVNVQGLEAEKSIVAGIKALDADSRPDVILVTRGGGSKEDLWVFNSERIARAAFACKKPVVSAVGHEIDYTILDYVADLRAPTPSAAAELCVPDQGDIRHKIFILNENIQKNMQSRWQIWYNSFKGLASESVFARQQGVLADKSRELARLSSDLQAACKTRQVQYVTELKSVAGLAAGLNPYAVLARGYTALTDEKGESCPVSHLKPGQKIKIRSNNAQAACMVEQVRPMPQEEL